MQHDIRLNREIVVMTPQFLLLFSSFPLHSVGSLFPIKLPPLIMQGSLKNESLLGVKMIVIKRIRLLCLFTYVHIHISGIFEGIVITCKTFSEKGGVYHFI